MDWSQPVEKTHKKEEKTKGLFDEPSEDMGLDWSTPASEAKKEDDDELKVNLADKQKTTIEGENASTDCFSSSNGVTIPKLKMTICQFQNQSSELEV